MDVKPHFTWNSFHLSYNQVALYSDQVTQIVIDYFTWLMSAQAQG